MISVRRHAIKRYVTRFKSRTFNIAPNECKSLEEEIIGLYLEAVLIIEHEGNGEIFAFINGEVVMIVRKLGRIATIITILSRNEMTKENWWYREGI